MSSTPKTSATDLLQQLLNDPDNDELANQAGARLKESPHDFAAAATRVIPKSSKPDALVPRTRNVATDTLMEMKVPLASEEQSKNDNRWYNCIKNQSCSPVAILYPTSRQDLVGAVKQAAESKQTVRAVGSGHSFSDVAITNGILLNPSKMNKVLTVDASLLRDASLTSTLFSVESGITIATLNQQLDNAKVALINMGAYDGQTLAGAISTGTHGTGVSLGPLASSVRSIVLVSETGTTYQIEPSNGITDPLKFAAAHSDIVLKQDDDWFQSNVIAMGCMGLIYSYTLEVIPAYCLLESRTETTWEALKPALLNAPSGKLPPVITAHRHYEIDVNPYPVNQAHTCIVTTRDINAGPPKGNRGFDSWISGLIGETELAQSVIVDLVNLAPKIAVHMIDAALGTLKDSGYIDKSYKVMNLGDANNVEAYALELSFDIDDFVDSIELLFTVLAEAAKNDDWYQCGPIGIRFVAPSQAYLGPQYGRTTCMAELDMLSGIKNGDTLLDTIQKVTCAKKMTARVHWGLELDTLQAADVPKMYTEFDKWLAVYHQLNSTGMFNSNFTDRIGISVAPKDGGPSSGSLPASDIMLSSDE